MPLEKTAARQGGAHILSRLAIFLSVTSLFVSIASIIPIIQIGDVKFKQLSHYLQQLWVNSSSSLMVQ